ncbi:MAG: thymidylate synthase [Candidatus Abyssobacteria bacterium SURF_5]|uniref:Thymidylate synthase n=1 Tax=Abyssobacteria bacterium (strain SURF_5) TaxID=2093360 RepID=A0A3A4P5C1_ABYX5|nr:MAG: thymidylate synthase [Candidatus Abyssubacteria bacterium SURF_5]
MEHTFIKAFSLPESWVALVRAILAKGREFRIDSGSYAGQTRRELDFVTIQVERPSHPPIVPTSGMFPPQCTFPPPTSLDYVDNDYVPKYLLSSERQSNETYTYGQRLMQQFADVVAMYKRGHRTNQGTIEIAQPADIKISDPPCLRLIDTRIQDNKLHFFLYFRSWDAWGGYPANMAGLQRVKELMAYEIGVDDGELWACSKGLHLYDIYFSVAEQLRMP